MIKNIALAVAAAFCVAACGGGGGDVSTTPAAKSLTLSFYGQPLVSGSAAVAHAASEPAVGVSAADSTVKSLQDALIARGVPASVTAQVMDGTTLHQIVMGENNGLPPTPDQFGKDPSEWMVVNFQLDDMASTVDVPSQAAAIAQFTQDLVVFVQRAAVSGKRVFAVLPIQTCDAAPGFSAAYGLTHAINQAGNQALIDTVGGVSINDETPDHLGADCRTPDAYLLNLRMESAADSLAAQYKAALAGN